MSQLVFYHSHSVAYYVANFRGATPTTAKVIGMHLLNFKPIINPYLKTVRGPLFSMGMH